MMTRYSVYGSVRGNCGHKHRTIEAAHACFMRDAASCQRVGGYSDRWSLRTYVDGHQIDTSDDDREYFVYLPRD
jgi:hypothetical protein